MSMAMKFSDKAAASAARPDGLRGADAPPLELLSSDMPRNQMLQRLALRGYVVIRFGSDPLPTEERLSDFLATIGQQIRIFSAINSLWKTVGVDTKRPVNRSQGTGRLPLHMDFVNAERPPDYSCLFCVRPDPRGGGQSMVTSLDNIQEVVAPETIAVLKRPIFRDGQVNDLLNVGVDINPFPIWAEHQRFRVRYTGHLQDSINDPCVKAAVSELGWALEERKFDIALEAGDLLITDQRRVLHGRTPLGEGQDNLPQDARRLMLLSFVNQVDV